MHYGLILSTMGPSSDPTLLATLAAEAERAGWDGVFVPDVVDLGGEPPHETSDPWISMAAMAVATTTIRLGPIVAVLPRHRPWNLARMATTLDRLSNGRLILGVGIGDSSDPTLRAHRERGNEEIAEARTRAEQSDEILAILDGLWSGEPFSFNGDHYTLAKTTFVPTPVQRPRIPIWVGWQWPNRRPVTRAARWDGAVPFAIDETGGYAHVSAQDLTALDASLREGRDPGAPPVELVAWFPSVRRDADFLAETQAMETAGVAWLLQSVESAATAVELEAVIAAGPPRP